LSNAIYARGFVDKANAVIDGLDASPLKNIRLSRFCGSLSQGLFGWLAHDARVIRSAAGGGGSLVISLN
jgi:hypothetical protein